MAGPPEITAPPPDSAAGNREAAPLVEELPRATSAETVLHRLSPLPGCLLLDSALPHPTLGRYSFASADPFAWLEVPADGSDALGRLSEETQRWRAPHIEGLPPFQGGAAGLFGYDLGRSIETVSPTSFDEFGLPALAVGLYDVVVALDHVENRAWLISHGFPETAPAARRERAAARARWFRSILAGRIEPKTPTRLRASLPPLSADELAPQFPVGQRPGLTSDFDRPRYLAAVRRAIEHIYDGDVFQVNLAQRLLCPAAGDAVSLYLRLRRCNPAPFAGYFDPGPYQILSASPERFLRVDRGRVETRPIKGTRRRIVDEAEDRRIRDELRQSEKDRAENVMIVDLLRNDLSRVCGSRSIRVGQLCEIETYEYVHHLVSAVEGTLRPECSPIELLRAAFPGGSITGAPKVRAMQIIAALEPTARGAYCGSLGYLGFDGSMDLSILIRTITAGRGWWQLPVGGGIVAQSDPQLEYEETWHKARGLLEALR